MRRFFAFVTLVICLTQGRTALAQNDFYTARMDSLAQVLAKQKNPKDSLLLLKQMADLVPIRANETAHYPDYTAKLLALNQREKMINPLPYRLIATGNQYWGEKQYAKALATLQQAVAEFDKQHQDCLPLLFNMRFLYNFLNDQDGRLSYYAKKLEYYQVNGPVENTAPCYHAIAGYYNYKGAFNQAIGNYLKGAEIFKRYTPDTYPAILGVVGSIYAAWGNKARATYYLEKAIPLQQTKYTGYGLQLCYLTLSQISFSQNNYKRALEQANESIRRIEKGPSQRMAGSLVFKAGIYLKTNKVDSAYILLNRVKAMADSVPISTVSANGMMEIDYNYYQYYVDKGNFPMAEKSLLKGENDAVTENGEALQLKYLRELGYFYRRQNKYDLSAKYFDKYFQLADEHEKSLGEFKVAQYEGEAKDRQQTEHINQLKQEKALQDYQLSRRNALLWGSLVVLLLISALGIFIYRQLHINKKTLLSLRKTQRQLIQSEKMASLGELTAGIAHEIQNPLNFVNNFSEVSAELVDEMQSELKQGEPEEAIAISDNIKQNLEKIRHHGKRADFIVKGMLEHSRTSKGERTLTNINVLADEFLKLSYHGLRARHKSFNAEMVTLFDEKLPKLEIVQQDIGRVLLNLFNNAFYAVNQKLKTAGADYKPTVELKTLVKDGAIEIMVKDNGNGIPDAIRDKIMQPFFTTKPTGEGTGLGLSLSYDIIVKGHGGLISVESKEGEFTEFKVLLPLQL